jgi:replicative DNA helicase
MPGEQWRRSFSPGALHPPGRLGLLPRVIDSVHDPAAGAPAGASADAAAPDLKRPRRQKPARSENPRLDRIPPHSLEAEKCVLGCVLLSPREGVGACFEQFARGEEFFYDPRHQTIFATIVELCDQQAAVDVVTLGARLQDKGVLETVGGYAYLNALMDTVPSAANLGYYLTIVREKYLLRRLISTCTRLAGEAYEETASVGAFLDRAEAEILAVNHESKATTVKSIHELVNQAMHRIEHFFNHRGQLSGLATGFPDLDRKTNGLQPGEMIVIAARPSMGKTSLAMNIAEHVATVLRHPVGVFSLEMTAQALTMRLLCSLARVNHHTIREGGLHETELARLAEASGVLAQAPLYIDDTAGLTILQLRARARRLKERHDIRLFVIDYLQLLQSANPRRGDPNRAQEIAEISSGVKALAKELDVPVIVLSQLNRELERDRTRKPRLSDLRESGAIEQDADVVGLLYKANPKDPREPAPADEEDTTTPNEAVPVNLLIAKQRNGPTGDVHLTFLKAFTRFESGAPLAVDEGATETAETAA